MTMTPGTPRGDGGKGKGVGGRVGAPGAPHLLLNPRLRPDVPPTSDAETREYSYTEPTPDSEQ